MAAAVGFGERLWDDFVGNKYFLGGEVNKHDRRLCEWSAIAGVMVKI